MRYRLTSKFQAANFLKSRTTTEIEIDSLSDWHLISTHGLVLACVAREPDITTRQIAILIGVTERTAHTIISDLQAASYLSKQKIGRKNRYAVDTTKPLGHPALQLRKDQETTPSVGNFLEAIGAIPHIQSAGKDRPYSGKSSFRRIFWRDSRNQREGPIDSHLDGASGIATES